MKNTMGTTLCLTLFGESHGETIGCVLDGLAPGLTVDADRIAFALSLRRPEGNLTTERREKDAFSIVSGVKQGKTTGAPLTILLPNTDVKREDYDEIAAMPRPNHADYPAYLKYHGFEDRSGGGHFSGRLTAPLVAAGAIVRDALEQKGICVASHITRVGSVCDDAFCNIENEIEKVYNKKFPILNENVRAAIENEVAEAKNDGDSVGGVIETAVVGLPGGVGEPWFDSMEGVLAKAMFAIPAVKGVEFGDGFALGQMRGSAAADALRAENGEIHIMTNHMGGISGGITNGKPVLFRCAVKPTPTLGKSLRTVNLEIRENTELQAKGRHDPCIALRMPIILDSVTALVVYDLLAQTFGTDWILK